KVMKPYPPLGILYLSAWLEKHGFENEVFDSTFSSMQDLHAYLQENKPDIIALYTNLMTKMNILKLVEFIRKEPVLKNALIVLGGPDVTYNVDHYLAAEVDLLVIGEGEQTMLEIVKEAQNKFPDWTRVPGLAFRMKDGSIFKTRARDKIKNLDVLPLPSRDKIDQLKYLSSWKERHGISAISVSTQRGCPYTCRWCSTAVYGQSYRRRSPSSVVTELRILKETYNPDLFWFVDDVFTISHKWIEGFYAALKASELQISFECITRAERLNDHLLNLLSECGCYRIWIGAESGSQTILDAMDRRVDIQHVSKMIIATRKKGIQTGTFIMLGYPGETEEDIFQTLHYLKKALPDQVTYTISYPITGTALYDQVLPRIQTNSLWRNTPDRELDFTRTYPRRYYDFALPWIQNSYRLSKARNEGTLDLLRLIKMTTKIFILRMGMLLHKWKTFA
ncbi:MAG: B12-binding domain-containing radical SAM protein, partial [Saprospiraceae bacterium]|nr:B12-binding domain-containing radical SAM protein [Saprospiraceae bacterium]